MSVLRLQEMLTDLEQEAEENQARMENLNTKIDSVIELALGGVPALIPELDLSALPGIKEVLAELPDEVRKDPRSACYFDHLDRLLDTLSG